MGLRIGLTGPVSKSAFGPFRVYHLSHGLTLEFNQIRLVVRGGRILSAGFPIKFEDDEDSWLSTEASAQMVKQVERDIGVKVLGMSGPTLKHLDGPQPETESSVQALPPSETVFRVDESLISGGWLAEELLTKLERLDSLVRIIMRYPGISESDLGIGREVCANVDESIRAGRLGPKELNVLVDELTSNGVPIKAAFFASNAQGIADDMRNSLLAACHHFSNMNSRIWEVNQNHQVVPPPEEEPGNPHERIFGSEEIDALSFEYASSVTACYSALDMLYELFVYLTREPFGNPRFPGRLHFSDISSGNVFREGGTTLTDDPNASALPLAIPNLDSSHFKSLRHTRNDLVHNMASDGLRPRVHVGWGLPPVNGWTLQYAQYLTRDIDPAGKPITHEWVRRFYENQTDAQHTIYEWLEQSWQCVFDTTEWLLIRLQNRVAEMTSPRQDQNHS